MIVMVFTREEYKNVVAPYLASLGATDYVSYYPEQPVVLIDDVNAAYLRLISEPKTMRTLGRHINDKKG